MTPGRGRGTNPGMVFYDQAKWRLRALLKNSSEIREKGCGM
jgi:hypothetical protein